MAVVAALLLLHPILLTGIAAFATVTDRLDPADAILPLGEGGSVPFAAADLFKRHLANRVLVARRQPTRLESAGLLPPRHEICRAVLIHEGVPADAITIIGPGVRSDVELGGVLAAWFASNRHGRIIAVSLAPFSRIARNDLRRGLSVSDLDVRMYPAEPEEFSTRTWWASRHGVLAYFDAYYLLGLRFVRR